MSFNYVYNASAEKIVPYLIFSILEGEHMRLVPKYINWFVEEKDIVLEDGIPITCYRLDYVVNEDTYCELALHVRQHYESDAELSESIKNTKLPVDEYLRQFIIPQKEDPFGATARSNDFTEILVSDLLEFIYKYDVPRCKQRNRSGKTLSEHGTDILAYKFNRKDKSPSRKDKLLAVEVKAGLSSDEYEPINKAVTDSHKYDEVRHSHTLNYYRKKLRSINNHKQANEISRFQQKSEHDFIIIYIATAIISRETILDNVILGIRGDALELRQNNKVFLIHGKKLMDLAHDVFERCIK